MLCTVATVTVQFLVIVHYNLANFTHFPTFGTFASLRYSIPGCDGARAQVEGSYHSQLIHVG